MQKLPNSQNAFIELAKLRDYCLSVDHPRGRHKARVFREALGLSVADVEWLRQKLLEEIQKPSCRKAGNGQLWQPLAG